MFQCRKRFVTKRSHCKNEVSSFCAGASFSIRNSWDKTNRLSSSFRNRQFMRKKCYTSACAFFLPAGFSNGQNSSRIC